MLPIRVDFFSRNLIFCNKIFDVFVFLITRTCKNATLFEYCYDDHLFWHVFKSLNGIHTTNFQPFNPFVQKQISIELLIRSWFFNWLFYIMGVLKKCCLPSLHIKVNHSSDDFKCCKNDVVRYYDIEINHTDIYNLYSTPPLFSNNIF